jgi:uridine kinase
MAVASFVTKGLTVVDIGTDHAYVPIYLVKNGISPSAIAMDINEGPIKKAYKNVVDNGLEGMVETRISDGFKELREQEAESGIIAGMGGELIVDILRKGDIHIKNLKELILSPHSEISMVREYLHQIDYKIIDEKILIDEGKYYTIIKAVPQKDVNYTEIEYKYGKILLDRKDEILKSFIQKENDKVISIINNLTKNGTPNANKKLENLIKEQKMCMCALRKLAADSDYLQKASTEMEVSMADLCNVCVCGEMRQYLENTSFIDIAKEWQSKYENQIVLVVKNGKLTELFKKVTSDCEIEFLTTDSAPGIEAYRRSATLIMLKAFYDVVGRKNMEKISVQYSISKGYYCTAEGNFELTQELLNEVKNKMDELVAEDIQINKRVVGTCSAINTFRRHKMYDKEKLFRFRRASKVNIYSIKGFEDYFYGYMVPSTGYIKKYELFLYDEGFVLQLPVKENPNVVPEFKPQHKLFEVLKESGKWSKMLKIDTVGALNEEISAGNIKDIILVSEALQEKKIAEIATKIASMPDKKFIMIAGPSSSGKTSFSHRLSIQLRANGLMPYPIAVDNYFVNRDKTPRDENGNYNFETLDAIDVKQFNQDMLDLLAGKTVKMPTYNFITGRREYKGNTLSLGKDDILVIEGIHGLNDKLSYALPKESKYKIYISALTQLNVDEHNRISTTDGRLIRRMVRDARTRGISAEETIARWQSVRNGEEEYIFPFQEEADVMFNSALIYELAVLKQFAEPLLFGISRESKEYMEAKRLLKFLDYFLGVNTENIPNNSLVREFVGGSCFNV